MHVLSIVLLVLSISLSSFAHRDPAYYHDANDGFNFGRNRWMENICDHTLLSDIAMPGTHDSSAFKDFLGDMTRTQCLNFDQQLSAGIRIFDIRIRHYGDSFVLHHGPVYLKLNFDDFLRSVTSFLTKNPSEVVMFRLKEEHHQEKSTRSMKQTMNEYMKTYKKWHFKTENYKLTLGETRGKFVIWIDHWEFKEHGIALNMLDTQDRYHLGTIYDLYQKWEHIKGHMLNHMECTDDQWHMNYLSGAGTLQALPYFVASGHYDSGTSSSRMATGRTTPGWKNSWVDFPRVNCFIGICTIAFEGTNILARDKIRELTQNRSGSKSVGIIMADFPGDSLIEEIIANNWRLCKK